MAAIYSNGDNRLNILGFNFTKRDALSSLYKISMVNTNQKTQTHPYHVVTVRKSTWVSLNASLVRG
jgi:hypothetical protein